MAGTKCQLLDRGDSVKGFQVIARDITDRKRGGRSLRESEKRYRDLFEHASDLIYTHDIKGNYTRLMRRRSGPWVTAAKRFSS